MCVVWCSVLWMLYYTPLCVNCIDIKPPRPHGQIFYQQQLSISDEVSVYLELCEAYCQLSRLTEAKELMEEAAKKFEATSQGMRYVHGMCSIRVFHYLCTEYRLQMLIWP